MRRSRYLHALVLVSTFAISAFAGTSANATAIGPGHDLFVTSPGATVDLSSFGLGSIPVEGVPIGPNPFGSDLADTIVERIQGIDPFNQCPTPPCSDTIDIEIVALQLKSVDPVDLSPLGGPFVGVFADLWATINLGGVIPQIPQYSVLQPSIGQMTINHDDPGGGTFTSCFGETSDTTGVCSTLGVPGGGVFADGIIVVPGGDPSNPLDVFFNIPAPRVVVSAIDGTWIHDGLGQDDFLVTSIDHEGPHPVRPVPEPGTAVLVGLGLALALLPRFRRG